MIVEGLTAAVVSDTIGRWIGCSVCAVGLRHGISNDRAEYVIVHCLDPIYPTALEPGEADRVLFLGPDQHGVPLEVLAIELRRGDYLVVHVMKLRRKYFDDFMRVMG